MHEPLDYRVMDRFETEIRTRVRYLLIGSAQLPVPISRRRYMYHARRSSSARTSCIKMDSSAKYNFNVIYYRLLQ